MTALADVATPTIEWALTYLLHSTILLGLAALLTSRVVRRDAWRETLWRGALLGPVLTATLATTLSFPTVTGRLVVPGLASQRTAVVASGAEVEGPPATAQGGGTGSAGAAATPGDGSAAAPVPVPESSPDGSPAPGDAAGGWSQTALLLWVGGAVALVAILLVRNLVLFRRLRGRRRLEEGRLVAMLGELRRNAGVWRPIRLSVSRSCSTPLVIGSTEICVPPRFVHELDEEAQRAALAHEVAHVHRRDPEWQLGAGLVGALLFFQPLNLLARRRLREVSEHLCDDWTVRQTGSPVHLGRCLTEIASWTSAGPPLRLEGTPAMAEGGSPLLHRMRRIAAGVPAMAERRRWAAFAVAVSLLATTAAAPVIGSGPAVERSVSGPATVSETTTDAIGERATTPGTGFVGAGQEPQPSSPSDTLEAIRDLERLAMEDPSPRVRQEAAARLSDFGHPEAANALSDIVRSASDPVVRAEAAQQLDEFPTAEVVAVLLEAVFQDPEVEVRDNALDVLDDFPMASARAALRRVAREHAVPEVRRAAFDALTDGG